MILKYQLIGKIYSFLIKNNNYSSDELKRIRYGLEGLYLTIEKLVVIVFFSIFLNISKAVIYTLLFFNILRFFAFGYHATNSFKCLLLSILFFIIIPIVLSKITITFYLKLIISVFGLVSFFLFAPADTKKRPFTNKNKIMRRKIYSILVLSIYISTIINTNNYICISIMSAIIIQSIIINPIIYKLG